MFKVNNKDTRTSCSSVYIITFEQADADWAGEGTIPKVIAH